MDDDKIIYFLDEPSSPGQFSDNESLFGPDSDADPEWDIENEYVSSDDDDVLGVEIDQNQPGPSNQLQSDGWHPLQPNCQLNEIPFNPNNEPIGINPDLIEIMMDSLPLEFWQLFVTHELIQKLVLETNRYAEQQNTSRAVIPLNARICKWVDCDESEMKKFLGIIMYMGLNPLPTITHYWRNDRLFSTPVSKIMTLNRFQLLLSMFHCSNNKDDQPNDRLHKVQEVIDLVINNFRMALSPEEDMCVDESIIAFLGRIFFRQYIKGKRHKYGINIFKLCVNDCYTLSYKVYGGKEVASGAKEKVSQKVVLELTEPYLNMGRTLYTDNWYTSVKLADQQINRGTHLVGTLRKNRKYNSKDVANAKLKRGESVARVNDNNIVIMKWKDKRDVLMLSTKHTDAMVPQQRHGKEILKPAVVVDYNKGKSFIDLSDQMAAYHNPLRRSVKWYRKVIFDLLLATCVTNALSLFKSIVKKITITQFKEQIVDLIFFEAVVLEHVPQVHTIIKTARPAQCKFCYKKNVLAKERQYAQKKTNQVKIRCGGCEINMCITCFVENHVCKPK